MRRLIAIQPETIIVADDHPLFRTAIMQALAVQDGETQFLEANSFESLQSLVDETWFCSTCTCPESVALLGCCTFASAIPACRW
jgi:hypothetical protein